MGEETGNPVIDAGQFLGEDGALAENWLEQAYGEEDPMRASPILKRFKDIRSMAKSVVHSEKQIGQFSGGREFAILPNEQSDENEINEFHTKLGRPPTAAEYKLSEMQLPEGLPRDDKLAAHMGDVLHKAGASSKVALAVHNGYAEYIKTTLEAQATQDKLDDAAANKELRGKLGAAYDKTMRDIGVMVNAFGTAINPTETANLLAELPNDSFAAQLLGKIAEKFSEGGLSQVAVDATGEMTPANAMDEYNKLIKDPYYMTASPEGKPKNQQYHDELNEKGAMLISLAKHKGDSK